jgi:pimeloyl-ACP methyl ester carboxylesterase
MWRPQWEEFSAEGYRVITPDLRGHGASPAPEAPWTIEDCAQDVLALADRLGLDRFVLGGLSVGAMVAMAVAEAAPARVEGLLLAATRADGDLPEERARRHALAARIQAEGREDAGPLVERVFAPSTAEGRPELVEELRRMVEETPPEGRARLLDAVADRKDRIPVLATLRCPTLVIVGTDDPITPEAKGRAIHAAVPGAFLQVVEGASHLVNMEAPGVFNRAVVNWLMFAGLEP